MKTQLSYGFTDKDLVLDEHVMDMAPDLIAMDLMCELTDDRYVQHDPYAAHRTLDMALALFAKLQADPHNAFDGLYYTDLFGAALYQAMVWENG